MRVFVVCSKLSPSVGTIEKTGGMRETKLRSFPAHSSIVTTDRETGTDGNVFVEDENKCQGTWAVHMRKVVKQNQIKCELLSTFKESHAILSSKFNF